MRNLTRLLLLLVGLSLATATACVITSKPGRSRHQIRTKKHKKHKKRKHRHKRHRRSKKHKKYKHR